MGLTKETVALMLELAGGVTVAFGVGLLAVWAGIVVAGVLLILFGIALERFEA